MWGSNRFGFWRALLPEEDREDDDREDREHLGLPVLHRFEPELGGAYVLGGTDTWGAVCGLFSAVLAGAGDGVQQPRRGEQGEEGDAQRVAVDGEGPSTATHRPGGVGIVTVGRGILVDVFGLVER